MHTVLLKKLSSMFVPLFVYKITEKRQIITFIAKQIKLSLLHAYVGLLPLQFFPYIITISVVIENTF
jgi:hypothetical protein